MKRFYAILVILTVLGVIFGYIIFPKMTDTALMNLQSSNYHEAIKEYEDYIRRTGDYSPEVIVPLSELYLNVGENNKAIFLLRKYILKEPDSIEARKLLSEYFKDTQRTSDFIEIIEEIAKLDPNLNTYKILYDLYQNKGFSNKSAETLNKIISQKNYKTDEADFRTLIYYYLSKSEDSKALEIINILLKQEKNKIHNFGTLALIVNVLLDSKLIDKANKIVLDSNFNNFPLAEQIQIANLFAKSYPQYSINLLNRIRFKKGEHDNIILALLNVKLSMNQQDEVLNELDKLFEKEKLSPNLLDLYLSLLISTKNNKQITKIIDDYDIAIISDSNLLLLATYLLVNNDPDTAKILKGKLTKGILLNYPSLDLMLTSTINGISITKVANKLISDDYYLTDDQTIMIAEALYLERDAKQSEILLARIPTIKLITRFDLDTLAQIALKTGQLSKYLNDISLFINSYNIIQIPEAYIIFLVADNDYGKLSSYLKKNSKDKNYYRFLETAFYSSINFERKNIALKTAFILNDKFHSQETTLFLAQAYVLNENYQKAKDIFSSIDITDKITGNLYLSILTQIAAELGKDSINQYKAKYSKALGLILQNKPSDDELRTAANFYVSIQKFQEAANIFFNLAKQNENWNSDVEQLAVLIPKTGNREMREWLKNKAYSANRNEKSLWINVLLNAEEDYTALNLIDSIMESYKFNQIILNNILSEYNSEYKNYIRTITPKSFIEKHPVIYLKTLYNLSMYEKIIDEMKSINISSYYKSTPQFKAKLFTILTEVGFYIKAVKILEKMNFRYVIQNVEPTLIAEAYIGSKKVDAGINYLLGAKTSDKNLKLKIHNAVLRLYAASGKEAPILKWIDESKNIETNTFSDIFYIALGNSQTKTALDIAGAVYQKFPNKINKNFYIEALNANKIYNKVLALISEPKTNFELNMYLQALADKYNATKTVSQKSQIVLNNIYSKSQKDNSILTDDQKRSMGYIYSDTGEKDKAKTLFFQLAKYKPVSSPDVEQLLYLIGSKTNYHEKEWLVSRAEKSKGMALVKWSQYLNQTNNPESTIKLIEEKVFEQKK